MKRNLVHLLICPRCGCSLDLDVTQESDGELESGLLTCQEGHQYPIAAGVPRLLVEPEGIVSAQTSESFASKWKRIPRYGLEGASAEFQRSTMLAKYGWSDEAGFARAMQGREMLLDAGTGLGREVVRMAEANPRAQVVGVEISLAAEEAYQNTRHLPNAHILQADINHLPFRPGQFDFILSEGVLHHTPDTRQAFLKLASHLKTEGELGIYVYVKKPPVREFVDNHLRGYTTRLTPEECWEFSQKITRLGKALWETGAEIEIRDDIEPLGIEAGRYHVQRFFYYIVMKCFWNETLDFDENNLFNFDWYHPGYAHSHTVEEVQGWYREAGLAITHLWTDGSGITARGSRLASGVD